MNQEHQVEPEKSRENIQKIKPPAKIPVIARPLVIATGTMLAVFACIYVVGVLVRSSTHESTDDAYLDARIIAIAPKVAGRVAAVPVSDNQRVKAGNVLVEIDPQDLQVALDQKKAALNAARANEQLLKADLTVSEAKHQSTIATAKQRAADAEAAEAEEARAKADFERAQSLSTNNTISKQEFDAAKAAAQSSEAALRAAREKAISSQADVAEAEAKAESSRKAIQRQESLTRQAEMDVKAAELNLSYAALTAPEDGQVTKKSVERGDYIQVGQRLLALVPSDLWVTANFKETQLRQIRPGQPATVRIDSVENRKFKAHVQSVQAGSGARFSLLPPENAVGNFVKVVQRVPVKIVFDEPISVEHTLGPGMSVVPSVQVKSLTVPEWVQLGLGIFTGLLAGILWFFATRSKRERS